MRQSACPALLLEVHGTRMDPPAPCDQRSTVIILRFTESLRTVGKKNAEDIDLLRIQNLPLSFQKRRGALSNFSPSSTLYILVDTCHFRYNLAD